jgi:hypothetical protein
MKVGQTDGAQHILDMNIDLQFEGNRALLFA